jgi:DNA adenine methylase
MSAKIAPPLKWHGGKHYLAGRIVALMPPHTHYVEPFAGGLSVLLAKSPEGVSEVVNDISSDLTNFWTVLRSDLFPRFQRACEATPFSELIWSEAARLLGENAEANDTFIGADPVRRAWLFFVTCRQSLAGRMDAFTGVTKTRVRRGMNNEVSAWLSCVEGLPAVHARLKRVLILNRDALDVIRSQDGEQTLMYLDPPYLCETRTAPDVYRHEMSEEGHHGLLTLLRQCGGKVMLSGYRSEMYDNLLARWTRHDFDLPNNAAAGASKRRMTESLWVNW